ncbi:MAG: zinc ABC transporter substrate-binding protein [candidate division Zixibacteria bacterium]|nr:zinc ABC transporter substrate-binding protein [candidate division Zixibacteria bacterium]
MIRNFYIEIISVLLALLAASVCFSASGGSEKPVIFVSIAPQAYFVERIGGDHVTVEVLVEPGHSPATYEPSPRQMAMLGEAQICFRIGLPFEDRLLTKIEASSTSLRIIDMREGIELVSKGRGKAHDAQVSSGEGHHHGDSDPHIWLDPMLVKIMAQNIAEELSRLDTLHKEEFIRNLNLFSADLDSLDARLAEKLAPLKGSRFYVFHPAYGYFGQAYGLTQVPIEVNGKEPTASGLATLVEQARADSIRTIFVQPQFSKKSAQVIADEINGIVVPMDPLAYDYLKGLEDMAEKLTMAFSLDEDGP